MTAINEIAPDLFRLSIYVPSSGLRVRVARFSLAVGAEPAPAPDVNHFAPADGTGRTLTSLNHTTSPGSWFCKPM